MEYVDKDKLICEYSGGKFSEWCKDRYIDQYFQKFSDIKDVIYPWNNRNWNYKQFVRNNYNPESLGLSKDSSIKSLLKNTEILVKQMESLISKPNPDNNSKAGISDIPISNNPNNILVKGIRDEIEKLKDEYNKTGKNRDKILELYNFLLVNFAKTKKISAKDYGNIANLKQNPPYNDKFFNKNLDGKNSSSYFIQNGFCKTKINNESECIKNGLIWLNGDSCFKNKYLYIDNSPKLNIGKVKGLEGLVPSVIGSISQLTPDNFLGILNGYSVPGLQIQNCEYFSRNNSNIFLISFIIFFIIGLIISLKKYE